MKLLRLLINFFPEKTAYAHCDIPCKIYDPYNAQVAAHSVIRMIQMIDEVSVSSDNPSKEAIHQVSRLTKVKEDHAEIVKHEVRVIWGDYFKEEHIKKYPQVHSLVHEIMQLASAGRQTLDMKKAKDLLSKVQEFAEIFYKTKGFEVVRIPSGFPTEGELVSHK